MTAALTIQMAGMGALLLGDAAAGGGFELTGAVIACGGGSASGGTFGLECTIGQAEPGTALSGGTFSLAGGFWPAAAPGSPPCPADCAGSGDGNVNVTDLLALLAQWGGGGSCDVAGGDGVVNVTDLLALLAAWGACP
jgi:hypothetical protein